MNQKEIKIPEYAAKALSILERAGHEAWCVGGCVRDALRGDLPHDWDICTSALPDEIIAAFSGFRTIPTGIKHGTVTVLIGGEQTEITTYRTDGDYLSHRKPEQVKFIRDIAGDLERRDFTMNAVCLNLRGELYDPFGGEEDIKRGIIRCVGDPKKRFDEDALRILRAVRFAAKTGFAIDEPTASAAVEMRGLLDSVSAERIFVELKSLLVQPNATEVLLGYKEIIGQCIPELVPCFGFPQNTPHHKFDVWEHIAVSVGNIRPDSTLRLVMLLHDVAKPEMFFSDPDGTAHFKGHPKKSAEYADVILRRLKSDTSTRKKICEFIAEHDNRIPAERKTVKRFISRHGYEFYRDWLEIRRADTLAQSEYLRAKKIAELEELAKIGEEVNRENCCLKIADLAANGSDLTALGLSGREVGLMLKYLLDSVIDEAVENERGALIALAERKMKNE